MSEGHKKRRVLVITSGPLSRNPRPLKEALALSGLGYQVTLLNLFHTADNAKEDERLLSGSGVELHTLDARRGFQGFLCRLKTWLATRAVVLLGLEPAAALGPVGPLLAAALGHEADLTIVHTAMAFWVGERLIRRGRRVAADFEDWHSEDLLPEARASLPLKLIRSLETAMLRDSCFAMAPSSAMANGLAAAHRSRIPAVVTNSFPLQPAPPSRPTREPELVWFSQTIGPGRGLEQFLSVWRGLASPIGTLTLVGQCIAGYDHALLGSLPLELRSRVTFIGSVKADLLAQTLARFDVGLALEQSSPASRDLTITNKILQYLNAGLAVVATPTRGQLEVFNAAPGVGITLDLGLPESGARLQAFLSDPQRLRKAQLVAREAAESLYCWELQVPLLSSLIETHAGKAP